MQPLPGLTAEQLLELERFPVELRRLVEAELLAGNQIAEWGAGFPAPPAGASLRLTKQVTTRPRASDGALHFFERNSSSYSGEFTDAQRFFFVLEPPQPYRPESVHPLRPADERPPECEGESVRDAEPGEDLNVGSELPLLIALRQNDVIRSIANWDPLDVEPLLQSEGLGHSAWEGVFVDRRSVVSIRVLLEQRLMALMDCRRDGSRVVMETEFERNGERCHWILCYQGATPLGNRFQLKVTFDWSRFAATHQDYCAKASRSWLRYWMRGFDLQSPDREGARTLRSVDGERQSQDREWDSERTARECAAVMSLEDELSTVEAIQRVVTDCLRRGWRFVSSHKEGGSELHWAFGSYRRSNHGDDTSEQVFSGEAEFLAHLARFVSGEVLVSSGGPRLEWDQWRLILRTMLPPRLAQ